MPLAIKLGHRRSKSSAVDPPSRTGSVASNSSAPNGNGTSDPNSPVIVVTEQPTSILKPHAPSLSSDMTGGSSSGSAWGGSSKQRARLSLGDTSSLHLSSSNGMPRSDTVDSRWSVGEYGDEPLSPGPSNSAGISPILSPTSSSNNSMTGMCPLPESTVTNRFPFFSMTISHNATLSFIALPVQVRPAVISGVQRAWRHGIKSMDSVDYAPELMKFHKSKGCDGGVWELTLKGDAWNPKSEDKVASKRIILYLLIELAKVGYQLSTSYRMSAKDSGKDTLIFSHCEPDPDPIFFAVAYYSTDRIWIIDAEADVGQALEEGIKATWVDGVKAARVRTRHCRELKLAGNPWVAHSKSQLISARVIHLTIMKYVTHKSMGYELVGNVSMADLDSNELPVAFFRKTGHGQWGTMETLPRPVPISKAAERSMNVGL